MEDVTKLNGGVSQMNHITVGKNSAVLRLCSSILTECMYLFSACQIVLNACTKLGNISTPCTKQYLYMPYIHPVIGR